jgi:membrane fusion protein
MSGSIDPLFRQDAIDSKNRRIEGQVILAQPIRTHFLVLLIFTSVVGLGLWLGLGTYTRTEMVRGILVTDVSSAKIVAIRPGQVTQLLVREGDTVLAGQRLVLIRTEQSDEGGDSAIGLGLVAIDNQQALAKQQETLSARRAASERERVAVTLAGLRRQRSDLQAQIAFQQQAVASARQLFERVESIRKSGFVSEVEIERRRQASLATQGELARLRQQISALDSQSDQAAAELARASADAGSELASARSSAQGLAQQYAQLRGQRAYAITAPISGRVASLQTGIGRTAEASVPLMEIVPQDSPLHAEIYAPTRAIGFVQPGEEVRLLYDPFPYQRFGSFGGRVSKVSRAVIDPRELAAPLDIKEAVYRIDVVPDAQAVDAFGQRLALQPGMTLTGDIVLDRRSFLEWLLEPLSAAMRRHA